MRTGCIEVSIQLNYHFRHEEEFIFLCELGLKNVFGQHYVQLPLYFLPICLGLQDILVTQVRNLNLRLAGEQLYTTCQNCDMTQAQVCCNNNNKTPTCTMLCCFLVFCHIHQTLSFGLIVMMSGSNPLSVT